MSISYSQKTNERLIGQSISAEPHTIGIVGVDTVALGVIRLVEVPQAPAPSSTISIPGYTEIFTGSPTGTEFITDYTTGVLTFDLGQDGNSVAVSYIGLGSEIAAEDINELQGPVGVALNYDGSLTSRTVKPVSISNLGTDNFSFPNNVIAAGSSTAAEFISATINPASAGQVRLAKTDTVDFRNNANGADLPLGIDGSDNLTFNGHIISTSGAGPVTSITGTANEIIASAATGNVTLSTPQPIGTSSTPTFASETLSATTNQLVLGTTRTVTVSATQPASTSRIYTIPDQGAAANFLMSQAAQTITGQQTFLASLLGPDGTVSLPGYSFSADTSSGLYRIGTDDIALATNGVKQLEISTTAITATLPITVTPTTNQLVLGTTNTTTINSTAPAASRVYTIPDAGSVANFVLDKGNYTIGGTWSFSNVITSVGEHITTSGINAEEIFTDGTVTAAIGIYHTTEEFVIGDSTLVSTQPFRWNISGGTVRIGDNTSTLSFVSSSNIAFGLSIQSGNNLTVNNGTLELRTESPLQFDDASNSHHIIVQAPTAVSSNYTLNLPTAQGAVNSRLVNDGSGNLSWTYLYSPVATKTSNYPITTADKVILANAAITITLPTAVGISGQTFVIKNITTSSSVTVNTTSSQTIDNQLTQILNSMSAMQVISTGSNWNII